MSQKPEFAKVIGKLQNGKAIGHNGQIIGRVNPDGHIVDKQGNIIGKVGPNGQIIENKKVEKLTSDYDT